MEISELPSEDVIINKCITTGVKVLKDYLESFLCYF